MSAFTLPQNILIKLKRHQTACFKPVVYNETTKPDNKFVLWEVLCAIYNSSYTNNSSLTICLLQKPASLPNLRESCTRLCGSSYPGESIKNLCHLICKETLNNNQGFSKSNVLLFENFSDK